MPLAIVTPDLDAIVSEIDISAPPERVFGALTDPEQLARWFTDASCPVKFWHMEARKGGSYSYATEKGNFEVNGVSEFECHGEILEIDPPRGLVYTWVANWHMDKQRKTIVRWELTPQRHRHARESHSQRACPRSGCARRLPGRLARRGGETQAIRGRGEGLTDHAYACDFARPGHDSG